MQKYFAIVLCSLILSWLGHPSLPQRGRYVKLQVENIISDTIEIFMFLKNKHFKHYADILFVINNPTVIGALSQCFPYCDPWNTTKTR